MYYPLQLLFAYTQEKMGFQAVHAGTRLFGFKPASNYNL
jgi:hypothetical protein